MRYAAQSRTFILVARKLCQSQTTLRGTFLFASVHNFDALTDPDSFACFGTAALLAVQTKSFHVSRASSEMKRRLSPITRVFFPPVYLSEPWKLWRGRKNLILLPRNADFFKTKVRWRCSPVTATVPQTLVFEENEWIIRQYRGKQFRVHSR